MALKQWHKTRWNGNKWHKDGLNTDRNMAYSSKCKTTIFEIQTREIRTLTTGKTWPVHALDCMMGDHVYQVQMQDEVSFNLLCCSISLHCFSLQFISRNDKTSGQHDCYTWVYSGTSIKQIAKYLVKCVCYNEV